MAVPNNKSDDALLKNLVPLNTLSEEQLGRLLTRIAIEKAKKGEYLFREGDSDHQNIYLLSGTVALLSGQKEMDLVSSGTQTARFALAHQLPRKHSARAKSAVTYVRIDSRMLSDMLARSQTASYEVDEAETAQNSDWMSLLLRSPVFQQIPPANLQRVMMRMRTITVSANETVIQQGEEGDYFYLISSGACRVTRQPEADHPPVELAQLKAGQGFGEEALISDKPRGSTVTMVTDGELVRLSKQDFVELVKQPLSRAIDYPDACKMIEENALWVDVRTPEEYDASHLPDAINLPFFSIRFQASSLASDRVYLIYGAEVGQSATAAYLLVERGYEVYMLSEGWAEIAVQAGLGEESTNLSDNVIDFNRDADASEGGVQLNPQADNEIDPELVNKLQKQLSAARTQFEEKLTQYQTEQKLLKQALGVAKRKLENLEKEAVTARQSHEEEIQQLQAALTEKQQSQQDNESEHKKSVRVLQEQVEELKDNLAILQGELKASAETVRIHSEEKSQLETTLEQERKNRAEVIADLEAQLQSLRQQQDQASSVHHAELQQAGEKAEADSQLIASLEEQVRSVEQQSEQFRMQAAEELVAMEQRLESLQRAYDENQSANAAREKAAADEMVAQQQQLEASQTEQASLQEKCDRLVVQLDEQNAKAAQDAEHANTERESQERQVQAFQDQAAALEQELSVLRQSSDSAGAEYQDLIDKLKAELEQSREAVTQLTQSQQRLSDERDDIDTRLDEALTTASERASELQQLTNDLHEAKQAQGQLGDQLSQMQEDLTQAQRDKQALENAYQTLDSQRAGLEREIESLRQAREDTDTQQQGLLASLQSELDQARASISESAQLHQQQMMERDTAEASLKSALAEANKRGDRLEADLQTTRDAHAAAESDLTRQLAGLEEQLNAGQQQLATSQAALQQLESEKQVMSDKQAELEQLFSDEQRQVMSLQHEITEVTGEHEAMQQTHAELQKKTQETAAEYQARLADLQETLDVTQTENSANSAALNELRKELKGQEEERIRLSAKLEESQHNTDFLQRTLATAEDAIEISDSALNEKQAAFADLQGRYDAVVSEKADLEQALEAVRESRKDEELQSRESQQSLKNDLERQSKELLALRSELEKIKAEEIEREAGHKIEREVVQAEKAEIERVLAEAQSRLQHEKAEFAGSLADQQQIIQRLEGDLSEARVELEQLAGTRNAARDSAQALAKAEQEIAELNKSIQGLREVQLEMEAQFSEDSEEEIGKLRAALESEEKKRRQVEELARQADALKRERVVQETAVEMLGEDLDNLGREKQNLEEDNKELARRMAEMRKQLSDLTEENDHLHSQVSESRNQVADSQMADDVLIQLDEVRIKAEIFEQERDEARAVAERMKGEVQELRSVIQTYVEQIQDVQSFTGDEALAALRTELDMVRQQASADLEQMRSELTAAKNRLKVEGGRDISEAAALQAHRQEIDSIKQALHEKEHMLRLSQTQCRTLEDSIEDRDREVDQLKRKLELLIRKTGGLGEFPDDQSKPTTVESTANTDLLHELRMHSSSSVGNDPKGSKLGRLFRKK